MKNNFSNVTSFVNLKIKNQNYENPINANYKNKQFISPVEGIKIYIRAIDVLTSGLTDMMKDTDLIKKLAESSKKSDKHEVINIKQSLAAQNIKFTKILEEFIRGFSISHDIEYKKLASVLYRSFNNILENFNLGYITSKTQYYQQSLKILNRLHSLFMQLN